MKNLVVRTSPALTYHTDVRAIIRALGEVVCDYEWFITDLECLAIGHRELPAALHPENGTWMRSDTAIRVSGTELRALVEEAELQFVWGVMSAFRPDRAPRTDSLDPYPIADGLESTWSADAQVQHPDAEFEIVCSDSSFTSLRTRNAEIGRRFAQAFPGTIDLDSRWNRAQQWWARQWRVEPPPVRSAGRSTGHGSAHGTGPR